MDGVGQSRWDWMVGGGAPETHHFRDPWRDPCMVGYSRQPLTGLLVSRRAKATDKCDAQGGAGLDGYVL